MDIAPPSPPFSTKTVLSRERRLSLTFIPDDPKSWNEVTLVRSLAVERRPVLVEWKPKVSKIKFGRPLSTNQLCACLSAANSKETLANLENGCFEYDPCLGTVLTPSEVVALSCTYVVRGPGEALVKAAYSIPTLTVSISVFMNTPEIVWKPKVVRIYLGAALDESNVITAFVQNKICKGRLEYHPPPGTVLPMGKHEITLSFVPDDASLIHAASRSLLIEIVKNAPKIVWVRDPVTGAMKATKV